MEPADQTWIPRRALDVVEQSLAAFRVVVLHGARQTGKTTLARHFAERHNAAYVTLDRTDIADAMASDPVTYLSTSGTPLVIDEVQRVGEPLILAVKSAVDVNNRPGQYLLTGSTNFLTVPMIAETLAGRTDIVTLWPLSQGELTGGDDDFVDRAFADAESLLTHQGPTPARSAYFDALCLGGYPAAQGLGVRGRRRWFARYVQTVLQREIAVAADIRRADALMEMVRYFAATTAQELVLNTVAQRLGIDRSTVNTYEPWLETVFLVHRLPAWSRNLTAKVVKRPKLYIADTGIAANLLAKDASALQRVNDPASGALFETFVVNEIAKQCTWCETPVRMFHFRDSDGAEVDLVLEADDGRILAIEFKASTTPRSDDFRWLTLLRDRLDKVGGQFIAGFVLHTGTARLRFGDRMIALPAADVWT
ncbi:ATP-binding protein [Mycobacterium sp. pUA109]|uniref:ATP-binding protein n=1 Tax=Mycobacterium sp. pUA109 TaxID=3238982 RepID=UPI00351BD440